jgi:hypothetical protein
MTIHDAPEPPVLAGTRRFTCYLFMPNRLQYCGGNDSATLLEHTLMGRRTAPWCRRCASSQGAMPYFTLIVRANGIADPFDDRVVEAYWIGNELPDRVGVRTPYDDLASGIDGSSSSPRLLELVVGKHRAAPISITASMVLDVHRRTGELPHALATLDNCRTSWGLVEVDGGELIVERSPLVLAGS